MKKNPLRNAALLAVVLMATAGIILAVHIMTGWIGNEPNAERVTEPVLSASEENAGMRPEAVSTVVRIPSVNTPRADVFKTNEDIRRKYGRVETVTLFSGKSYTGAVVSSTATEYSIVTVGGVMKVPLRNVKMRVIIR